VFALPLSRPECDYRRCFLVEGTPHTLYAPFVSLPSFSPAPLARKTGFFKMLRTSIVRVNIKKNKAGTPLLSVKIRKILFIDAGGMTP